MRIAVVNNFFPPRTSGSAHLSESLAQRYASAGHEVLVLTAAYRDAPSQETVNGYRVERLKSITLPALKVAINFDISFTASFGNVRRLRRLLDDFRPDVIHQHGQFFDLTWMSSVYARRNRIPVVLSVHTRLESPARLWNAAFWLADATWVRFFLAMSRAHVVVMDRLMDQYLRTRYGLNDERLTPIPVGVDPNRFPGADGIRVRTHLGIGDRPMVLSVGHVIPLRDRLALVRALPLVVSRIPEIVVVVVGTIHDDRFLQLARELGVDKHILCPGTVPKIEIPEYLAAAQLEVHDLQGYGLGTATLESMAAGVPIIAAVEPDNFPWIQLVSGKNCVLVPLNDDRALAAEIERVILDPDSAAEVAENQQGLVHEYFSLDAVTTKHLALFERILLLPNVAA